MKKSVTHTYTIGLFPLDVRFADRVVSIDFTAYVKKEDLTFLYCESESLIQKIKADYKSIYQRDLKIASPSFIAEIWGHLVAYRIALWMKRHFKISPLQKLAKFAAFRSGMVDCGEAKVDTNRWFWDIIGTIFFRKYK